MPQLFKSLHTIVDQGCAGREQAGEFTMHVRRQRGTKAGAMWGVLCIAIALLWSSATKAETRVYLLRGWFGVFSTGLDSLSEELRSKGLKAEAVGDLAWRSTVSAIVKDRAAGKSGPLVLV